MVNPYWLAEGPMLLLLAGSTDENTRVGWRVGRRQVQDGSRDPPNPCDMKDSRGEPLRIVIAGSGLGKERSQSTLATI